LIFFHKLSELALEAINFFDTSKASTKAKLVFT